MTSPTPGVTADELARLRELAEKATPGPWQAVGSSEPEVTSGEDGEEHAPVCFGHDYDDYGSMSAADAAYIAAQSPDVTLRLLAHVEALEARVRTLTEALEAGSRLAYQVPGAVEFDGQHVPDEQVSVSLRRDREAARTIIAAYQSLLPTADDVLGILADSPPVSRSEGAPK